MASVFTVWPEKAGGLLLQFGLGRLKTHVEDGFEVGVGDGGSTHCELGDVVLRLPVNRQLAQDLTQQAGKPANKTSII